MSQTNFEHPDLESIAKLISMYYQKPQDLMIEHIKTIKQCDKMINGLDNIVNTVEEGSEENVRKQLKNTIITCRNICSRMGFLAICNMIYIMGDTMKKDMQSGLLKLGADPQQLLKHMFNEKLKGNN